MTSNLYDEKEVMEEFISCYKHFTALWDNSSADYLSKWKKDSGYQELLKILRRVNRDASIHDVKRKINSLRCCYRREIKKIQISFGSYEPRLWWFHLMDFLKPVLNNLQTLPDIKNESLSQDDSLDETSLHVNSKEYRNRALKQPAYARLLAHLRQEDPKVNIHMVKRKINNLRTSYRRELRKVIQSKAQSEEDEYAPSLWYFHELDFLHEMETGEASTLLAPTDSEYIKENASDESIKEIEPDEDIFAEPFPSEEDMLVMEGDADVDVDADVDPDGDGDGDGDADLDTECLPCEGEAIIEEAEHKFVNTAHLRTDLKMNNIKYQLQQKLKAHHQQQHSNGSNNNNNSNIKHAHSYSYPYATNQIQQQQAHNRRSASSVTLRAPIRRRQRSSDVDGDYEDNFAVAAAVSPSKKRRHVMDQMISRNNNFEHVENECDIIGKRMAAHFRNMRADQRLFAERIISEVLVYGRMNRLSLEARFLPNGDIGGSAGVCADTIDM